MDIGVHSVYQRKRYRYPNPKEGPQNEYYLSSLQLANSFEKPLLSMGRDEQEKVFVDIAERVEEILRLDP